jgi:hypothetical protein
MNYKFKILLILLSSGFFLYFINTTLFPISEKQNDKVSQYWFQQAYFRNEIYLYTDKIKEKRLLYKLKIHSKKLKERNNINSLEYLNLYNEYINQMQQLSRMILELGVNAQFIMDDIVFIFKNLNISENDAMLIKRIKLNIESITIIRNTIKQQNEEINSLKLDVNHKFTEFDNKMHKLSAENNNTIKLIDSIVAELPLVMIIGKIKYSSKYGLKKPDFLLKPIRDYGEKIISLKKDYEKLLSIYKKQISRERILNQIANYFVYFIFIGLLIYEVVGIKIKQ